MKMGVFINSGNGYQSVKVAEKIDFEPVENVSNLEPSNKGELNIQVTEADDDFEFIKRLFLMKRKLGKRPILYCRRPLGELKTASGKL